ncbi:MAG: hypothetical protein PCALPYG88_5718 [uncultured Paraburkholderia sp.]|uniref:hypothetical protein n=1 Tax=uncultured Paraburkholderia sp. TaxID=1822466 RepID=UPI0025950708|nr:hypothetical protein [uncultured Paraburkholderia sp.]CAH2902112.1 MAG: hypothetical protein PCALPYG08_5826 [uncultured Paraburkholderia sp.]CAH2936501.1 MAG: hypothetical protein PCALPYG88_5718 [uncultured Paraburkholderia sp.]
MLGVSLPTTRTYPGSLLRNLDVPGHARLSTGDELLMEFSDGTLATGQLPEVDGSSALLQMPTCHTQRRTTIESRAWRVVASG